MRALRLPIEVYLACNDDYYRKASTTSRSDAVMPREVWGWCAVAMSGPWAPPEHYSSVPRMLGIASGANGRDGSDWNDCTVVEDVNRRKLSSS